MKASKILLGLFLCISISQIRAQSDPEIIGRWNLEVESDGNTLPSWLEVKKSGIRTLVGYFVSFSGSARPISEIHHSENRFSFSIPPQWTGAHYMTLNGEINDGKINGNILSHTGDVHTFTGTRAPDLLREVPQKWTKPRALLSENSLKGWKVPDGAEKNQWKVKNGVLISPESGSNLMTEEEFDDFKLHIEFQYPEHSNSGVYLRGRYEVQVEDSYGKEPSSLYLGGVYGFLTPNENVSKRPGEWQSYDITLVGRRVTVVANGKTIISDQIIPGITGGALDSKEGEPGPILLQGDHGPVQYRNITIAVPAN